MRKAVALLILSLFLFNALAYALPLNEQKLLGLRPLLSERIRQKAEEGRSYKLWPALISAAVGAAVIAASQNQSNFSSSEDQRLNNLEFGWLFLSLGASLYTLKSVPEINPALLDNYSQPGLEREKAAYLLFKNNETEGKVNREHAGFIWSAWGFGIALMPLATPNASSQYKSAAALTGLVFAGLGLIQYVFPSEPEKEMQAIDAELAR